MKRVGGGGGRKAIQILVIQFSSSFFLFFFFCLRIGRGGKTRRKGSEMALQSGHDYSLISSFSSYRRISQSGDFIIIQIKSDVPTILVRGIVSKGQAGNFQRNILFGRMR